MTVEGLFSDSGFWGRVLKESGEKILQNSGLSLEERESTLGESCGAGEDA